MTDTRVTTAPAPALDAATAELLAAGFPSPDLVGPALALLPVPQPGRITRGRVAVHGLSEAGVLSLIARGAGFKSVGEGIGGYVVCSPGTVGLLAVDEARRERTLGAARKSGRPINVGTRVALDDGEGYVDAATGEVLDGLTEVQRRVRGRITEWSGKSRANMIRRMAATDWRPMFDVGVAPMTTVTYPGPWTAFAPTRATVGRHLEAFKEAYRKAFGPVMGAWKVEYQRRGAPHVHMLLPVPVGWSVTAWREWVAETWHGIVWRDREGDFLRLLVLLGHDSTGADLICAEHRARHLAAGTAVDVAEGVRCRDPRRIALYFLGHSLSHARDGGKEYQHRLPASYAGRAGRWWGVWGLSDASAAVPVDVDTWLSLRDLLGAWAESQGRHAFQGGRMVGGWLAVNDGPAFLSGMLLGSHPDLTDDLVAEVVHRQRVRRRSGTIR